MVYANTLNNKFALDDDVVYLKNSYVQAGTDGIKDIFTHGFLHGYNQRNDQSYRPLVLFNFAIEHQIFGNNPKAHHFFNIVFFSLLCLILFQLLNLLFQKQNKWMAFWIVLLFIAHPIHTEVVANIKGRDDLLHSIFYLLTIKRMLQYFDTKNKKHLFWSLLFLFFAALCKEIAITLVAIVPLSIYVFREVKLIDAIKKSTWLVVPVVAYFLLRNQILDNIAFEDKMTVINNGIAAGSNFQEQLALKFSTFAKYIQLLFFPIELSWDYSYPYFPIVSLFNPKVLLIAILSILVSVWSIYAVIKTKNKVAYGVLFFLISFSIVSNFFILIGATLGERFLFLPSIGFLISIVFLLNILLQNIGINVKKQKQYLGITVAFIAVLLSIKTINRNRDWKNSDTLFKSGYQVTPTSSRSVLAYAAVYRGQAERSTNPQVRLSNFNKAIQLYIESINLLDEVSDSWYNLGVCYQAINKPQEAVKVYLRALEINPNDINSNNNLGVIYFQSKNYEEAKKYFNRCIEINDSFAAAYANLGAINHNQGHVEIAKQFYLRALQLNPNDQNTKANLSKL